MTKLSNQNSESRDPPAARTGETVDAQHGETGRMWRGPRGALPRGYSEVSDPPVGGDALALRISNLRHKSAGDMYADWYGEEFRGDPAEIADMLESQAATIATLEDRLAHSKRWRSKAYNELSEKYDEAQATIATLQRLLHEVAVSGVEHESRRYLTVQIGTDVWAEIRAHADKEPPA